MVDCVCHRFVYFCFLIGILNEKSSVDRGQWHVHNEHLGHDQGLCCGVLFFSVFPCSRCGLLLESWKSTYSIFSVLYLFPT